MNNCAASTTVQYNNGSPDCSIDSKWFDTTVDELKASCNLMQRKIPFKHIGVLRSSFCFFCNALQVIKIPV